MNAPHAVPMYDPAAAPDGWHDVRAPGGYEWWYFDAQDEAGDTQVVAILLHGYIFHSGYLRRYGRWLRRPSELAPPLPDEAVCAYFSVYRGGRVWRQFLTQYPALDADPAGPRVTVGPNTLVPDGRDLRLHLEGTPWKVTARGPRLLGETLGGDLSFTPTLDAPPVERTFLGRAMTGADHRWVLANPRCRVAGTLDVAGGRVEFAGTGYHDHNYGTAPIGPGLKRWIWGRAFDEEGGGVWTFHHAVPADPDLPLETHVLRADGQGAREVETAFEADWSRRSATRLAYPAQVGLGGHLTLSDPRLVEDAPFYLRATYETDRGGRAFCEIAHPHRLRWPVLGRMVEMSIDKRPMTAERR